MSLFAEVLLNGQMASPIVRAKLTKLLAEDYSPHAAINNVIQVAEATLEAGQALGLDHSLLGHCHERVIEAIDAGLGAEDMVALEKLLRR